MTARVAQIWRHPIKSHGCEALARIAVTAGRTLPFDRVWAVLHEAAKADGSGWAPCVNFSIGSKAPGLMAISAELDEGTGRVRLTHPDRPVLDLNPDDPAELPGFLDWVRPLMPADRAASARIVRVAGRGMTDTDYPSASLAGLGSLAALSDRMGQPLDSRRFRINFWIDGLEPWEEFGWIGREIAVGGARFRVEERIRRCKATTANPETGLCDADTLAALESGWGHRDLGVYLAPIGSGEVAPGDAVTVLP